jgi:trigger factor
VKSAVETLNPTRVRLTVEVPFEELKPSLDAAYKKIAGQVNVPGFRRGKVPAPIIDQRFGRAVVLEEAVNEALPRFYGQAVEENKIQVLGQPEVDLTDFSDGSELKFTAEVDVRPEIELPEYRGLEATVDEVAVSDEDVASRVDELRDRFAVLTGVDRAVESGDYVSLDLVASKDGEPVEDGAANGVSYEVGSATMLDGLDDAVTGLSAGEQTTFDSKLLGGELAGQDVQIEVTVKSVKVKELPELDDEFAQSASEFDTLEELRADVRERLGAERQAEQLGQARDKVLEALLAQIEVPLPESLLSNEISWRQQNVNEQLQAAGLSKEAYLSSEEKTSEEFDAEVEENAKQSIRAQFVLDAIATKEQLSVGQAELTQHIIRRAQSAGMAPDAFAQQVVQAGQVPAMVSEVVRGKALALIVGAATVRDSAGNEVDTSEAQAAAGEPAGGQAEEAPTDAETQDAATAEATEQPES